MRAFALISSAVLAVSVLGAVTVVGAVAAAEDAAPAVPADTVRLTINGKAVANTGVVAGNAVVEGTIPWVGVLQVVDAAAGTVGPLYEASGGAHENPLYTASLRISDEKTGLPTGRRTWSALFTSGTQGMPSGRSAPSTFDIYFWDSAPGSTFYEEVLWFGGQGLTTGYGDKGFHPNGTVSRDAMAAFLYRLAHPRTVVPECRTAPFPDVPVTNPFCGAVAWLANSGITTGYADGTFRPAVAVDRQALAVLMFRTVNPTAPKPTCPSAPFKDVSVRNPACGEIAWLSTQKLTNGFADGTFRGAEKVSRAAFAAITYRQFSQGRGN